MCIYAKFIMIIRKTFRIFAIILGSQISRRLASHPDICYPVISSDAILASFFQLIW